MYKTLRIARIIFAILFFALITASFLNFSGGNPYSTKLLHTQFIPAFVAVFTGSFVAFAILLLLTLLFGRVYCSFLCPLGILQDIIARISSFFKKGKNTGKKQSVSHSYKKPHHILRYSILILAFGFFFAGITTPLVLLDPYSVFGKISVQVFGSVELWGNNLLANLFPDTFYYQPYIRFSIYAFAWSLLLFLAIFIISMFRGRLYCNSVCPVGSLLGLLSGLSLFKPEIKKSMCVKCNACVKVCKSNCINLETKEIDATRCVACFNCMTSCKRGGVELVPAWKRKKASPQAVNGEDERRQLENPERRNALITAGVLVSAIAARKFASGKEALLPQGEKTKHSPIAPPGAGDLETFQDLCTGCHACIAACPNKIIKPSVLEYGLDGFLLPTISYERKFCAYDCNACSIVCPHGALKHLSLEEKQLTQIGRARYIAKNCIVFTDSTDCGACDEHCPTKAIVMTEVKGKPGLYFPKLNKKLCIGCGACEYICPAESKAIIIDGSAVQGVALPPKIEKQDEKQVEGFGF